VPKLVLKRVLNYATTHTTKHAYTLRSNCQKHSLNISKHTKEFIMKKQLFSLTIAASFAASLLASTTTHAHTSDGASAISAISALPVASVVVSVVGTSAAASTVVALPVALSVTGAVLIVKSVELSARGAICVLERTSDGARVSLELTSRAGHRTSLAVGDAMTVSVIGAGAVISFAGEVIAFVPNELGRALLHNERVTF
jgi:hypothetical protein